MSRRAISPVAAFGPLSIARRRVGGLCSACNGLCSDPAKAMRTAFPALAGLILGMLALPAHAMGFAFDPSPGAAGYFVYTTEASCDYTSRIDLGPATTGTIGGLDAGQAYYFVVTAYDADGSEGFPSNEVSFTPGLPVSAQPIGWQADGSFLVAVSGTGLCDVMVSEDLAAWSPLARSVELSGSFAIRDTSAAGHTARFYKLEGVR